MSENEEFFLVGVAHPIIDGPCLCTPLFRSANGEKYYMQESVDGYTVSGFTLIKHDFGENFASLQANTSFQRGSPIQYGMKWTDENPLVFDLEKLHSYFINYYSRFAEHHYLFFQMAFLTNDAYAIIRTLQNDIIKDAIKKRTLRIALRIRKSGGRIDNLPWSDAEVIILRMLWRFDYSSAEIARSLGRTRNAVMSMVKRLKLRRPQTHELNGKATLRLNGGGRIV